MTTNPPDLIDRLRDFDFQGDLTICDEAADAIVELLAEVEALGGIKSERAMNRLTKTAPERIFLQVSDEEGDDDCDFSDLQRDGAEVTWCDASVAAHQPADDQRRAAVSGGLGGVAVLNMRESPVQLRIACRGRGEGMRFESANGLRKPNGTGGPPVKVSAKSGAGA